MLEGVQLISLLYYGIFRFVLLRNNWHDKHHCYRSTSTSIHVWNVIVTRQTPLLYKHVYQRNKRHCDVTNTIVIQARLSTLQTSLWRDKHHCYTNASIHVINVIVTYHTSRFTNAQNRCPTYPAAMPSNAIAPLLSSRLVPGIFIANRSHKTFITSLSKSSFLTNSHNWKWKDNLGYAIVNIDCFHQPIPTKAVLSEQEN